MLPVATEPPHASLAAALLDALGHLPGAIVVDAQARIRWLSPAYAQLLGVADPDTVIGWPVEQLIPHSKLRDVAHSGHATPLDFLQHEGRDYVVTRLPLWNQDTPAGAIGLLLYEEWQTLSPLVARFQRLQRELDDARRQLSSQRPARYQLSDLIGQGHAATRLRQLAERAAQLDTTVLLQGETGTGKELLAQAIHHASQRQHAAFVGLNIAALPDSLLEAELFGAAPGAYTGADRKGREGKFQQAQGGTLFLDEIGDLALPLQAKLLRVLQEQEIEPLGANRLVKLDVRIIAATSRDLPAMVQQGQFRADLYYRLNILPITLPPLRERSEDIPLLVRHLLLRQAERTGLSCRQLSTDALYRLTTHAWPGNIRELRNVLEQACLYQPEGVLDARSLHMLPNPAPATRPCTPLADLLAATERQALLDALAACQHNRSQAAQRLGISRATLYEKLARHGIR
ncbi:sigma-54 interaction domain-containing protein [Leeia aquatica]|uniref:Sigma 54-interacting transcriptional regulator n=1 Tax=Leeia aquatica TaxID=2725557 RepID=A0A847S6M9_9NEIS|nr:sigma 54-interacting transcriptional regulator [Leeia aquatica]NLR74475.1 sigma 54-interacting transcriptional regulator [Leeia aquatica]